MAEKKKTTKKTTAKKVTAKKATVKKTAVKKVSTKKTTTKKVTVKKTPTKKTVTKKKLVSKKRVSKKPLIEIKDTKDVSQNFVMSKYETGAHTQYPEYYRDPLETEEPPFCYDVNRVVMLPVDPTFAFMYWEVREDTLDAMFKQYGYDSKLTLRIYDVTNIDFNGSNANEWWNIEIYDRIGTWYLKHNRGDRNLVVDIGLLGTDGSFNVIYRSKTIYFPRGHMVPAGKILWLLVDEFGNKQISDIEDYTEEDLKMLRLIMGDERFKRFMKGGLEIFLGASAWGRIPEIESFVDLAKIPSSRSGSMWR